jgi:hypothetical protein
MWKNTGNDMLPKTVVFIFDLVDDLETNGMKPKITLTPRANLLNARFGTTYPMIKSIPSNKSGVIVSNRNQPSNKSHPAVTSHLAMDKTQNTIESKI